MMIRQHWVRSFKGVIMHERWPLLGRHCTETVRLRRADKEFIEVLSKDDREKQEIP